MSRGQSGIRKKYILKERAKRIGVIDVGGGQRAVYGAGVFDRCLDLGVQFDAAYGISAGSANVTSYLAGQRGRNHEYYTNYCLRKEYSSPGVFARTGSVIDLRYVYGTLSNSDGEYPLNFPGLMANPAPCTIVATDAETGQAIYFGKEDMAQDDYRIIMASCSVPVFCRPFPLNGRFYYDGAISDPVPIARAFADGCDAVVVILTRPKHYFRTDVHDRRQAKLMRRQFHGASRAFARRAATYNRELRRALALERDGRVLIVAPDDIAGMKTFGKTPEASEALYQKGLRDAAAIPAFIEKWR